jgi:alpha-beta hydrolase superfamily lysophospholipase
MKEEKGWFESGDGTRLLWRRRRPDSDPRATLLFVHGLAEHSGRYLHVLERFSAAGYDCWALDYRCHGESPGLRVHVERFDEFVEDVAAAHRMVREAVPQGPLVLVGHSQGGLLVLRYVVTHPEGVDGIIISSPFLGMHPDSKPPAALQMVANIISTFSSRLMFSKVADPSFLSRTPGVAEAYVADPLVSSTVSARWFTEVIRAQLDTRERAGKLAVPALIMQSGDDRLVDPAVTRAYAAGAPAELVEYVEWPGLYHEMFNEPEREQVFERMEAWLGKRFDVKRSDV